MTSLTKGEHKLKKGRHTRIIELIQSKEISTQDELLSELRSDGFNVTQATVSRDVKELKLIKRLTDSGKYCYAVSEEKHTDVLANFESLFSSSVISVECAQNLVVIKTESGMAQAVCTTVDALGLKGVLGSIAGDDTIFLAVESIETAKSICSKLRLNSIYDK